MRKLFTISQLLGKFRKQNICYIFIALFLAFAQQSAFAVATVTFTGPVNGATNVNVNIQSLRVNFSFTGNYNPGNSISVVRIKNATTNAGIYDVTVSTNIYNAGFLDIPLPGPLPDNTLIQVVITGQNFDLDNNHIFSFTTQNIAPFVKSILPSTATGIRDTTKTFYLTFSENITKGTGNISFTNLASTVVHSIGVSSAAVTISQNVAIVKVPINWTVGNQFKVSAPAGAFKDLTNINSTAYTSPTYSVYNPTATLQKIGQSPASTDTIASTATTIKIIFNKPILLSTANSAGSPDIIVQNGISGPSITRTYGTMNYVINNNELTLTYTGGYWPYTGQNMVRLAQSSLKDAAGNILTSEVIASFYVKCVVAPPTPAPLLGDTNMCASIFSTLTTASISGVTYDWISSGAANTPTNGNSYSFYYPNSGTYTLSVATRQGPCFSNRIYKTVKVKSPITVAAGISGPTQVTVGTTANNYYLSTTINEANNIDSAKWYQDGVYKGTNFNNYFTWNTVGAKQVRVVLKNKCGSIEKLLTVNVVSSDATPPTITTYSPLNNATGVNVSANLVATFSEPITAGTGAVSIYTSTGALFASYTLPSANVAFSGSTLTINPSTNLAAGTIYYVNISNGAVKDAAGNSFVGIANATTWRFTTASGADVTPPTVTTLSPANLAINALVSANLVATFSENIISGTGTIEIRAKATGLIFESFALPSSKITFSGNTMTINPTNDFGGSVAYYVTIPNGAVKDVAGNNYAGLVNNAGWSFTTTTSGDATPPTVFERYPVNGSTFVEVTDNLFLNFTEPIVKVAGKSIQIFKTTGSVLFASYTTDSPEVTFGNTSMTINPTISMDAGTDYYVQIAAGAVRDNAGNDFAGFLNATGWYFKTMIDVTSPTVVSLSPVNNATNVAVSSNFVLTASEPLVKVPARLIQLAKLNGDVVVGNYTTDSPEVTFSGNTMTINPSFNLDPSTTYFIYLANGFAKDAAGNFLTGTSASSAYWRFTTSTITSMEEETIKQNISVWPNPVQNELTIQTEGFVSAELFDIAGVQVAKGNSSTMNISELAAGVYILNVKSTNGNFRKQIVKK